MNRQIRRVAGVVLVAFVALLLNLNYWQVVEAGKLSNDPRNTRTLLKEYSIQRGSMVAGGKVVVAQSVPTADSLKFLRRYPQGSLYGFVTGYYSLVYGRAEAEQRFNQYLIGQAPEQFAQNLIDFVSARPRPGDTLLLTLDPAVQQVATSALGSRKGAVVALDYTTGAVLALASYPSFDPNPLSSHDSRVIRAAWQRLVNDPGHPLVDRATSETYPPGSTFKVITAAAALENGMRPQDPLPNSLTYTPPQTRLPIRNFGGEACLGGKNPITLAEALQVSCNTAFARLGNTLGAQKLVAEAGKFGLNQPSPFQLPAAESVIPGAMDPPSVAQSAIGQRDVRVTPLQMAQVAATIANGGVAMSPFVVRQVIAQDGSLIKDFSREEGRRVLQPAVAASLRDMMGLVVQRGTGTAGQLPGIPVFGKTGTAQHGAATPHAWFIAFASSGGRHIAVAVLIEDGGSLGSEATGGRVAAPVARAVMQAYLGGGP